MEPQSNENPLEVWIKGRLHAEGPATVAQFMEWALYHPEYGYYTAGPNIGPRGDFTTSPEASPAFGRLLAAHVADIDRLLGRQRTFDVVEFGPGRGTLAADLLGEIRSANPGLYGRLRYRLVDVSPGLVAEQKQRLLPEHEQVVSWAAGARELPQGLSGAVLANEVVDAFPVHVVEVRDGQLVEQYVALDVNGTVAISYGELSDPSLTRFLDEQGIALYEGERIEVNLAVEGWIRDVGALLREGVVTIIDYGDTAPNRYSPARREGTLLGYFGGAVTESILLRPGSQDLTALVDFTHVEAVARSAGFEVTAMTRQANFLVGLGLGTTVTSENSGSGSSLEEVLAFRRGTQALISMEGLGRFHVLILSKGVDTGAARAELSGLKYHELRF
jgi:SAM-dependent MidA family methyltransferase